MNSLQPAPGTPVLYGNYRVLMNTAFFRDVGHYSAVIYPSANLANHILSKFSLHMPTSSHCRAMFISICHILFARCPSKIRRNIIRPVPVIVRYFVFRGWRRPVERAAYKAANNNSCVLVGGSREVNAVVARYSPSTRHLVASRDDAATAPTAGRCSSPHTPSITDLIIGPAFHNAPFFGKGFFSHIALLLGAVRLGASDRLQPGFWSRYSSKNPQHFAAFFVPMRGVICDVAGQSGG